MPAIQQAAILCGGLGTRLGALTAAMPKPLLPVGERPFLDKGKSAKSLQRENPAMTIEQVRELLNKNK